MTIWVLKLAIQLNGTMIVNYTKNPFWQGGYLARSTRINQINLFHLNLLLIIVNLNQCYIHEQTCLKIVKLDAAKSDLQDLACQKYLQEWILSHMIY